MYIFWIFLLVSSFSVAFFFSLLFTARCNFSNNRSLGLITTNPGQWNFDCPAEIKKFSEMEFLVISPIVSVFFLVMWLSVIQVCERILYILRGKMKHIFPFGLRLHQLLRSVFPNPLRAVTYYWFIITYSYPVIFLLNVIILLTINQNNIFISNSCN